MVSDAKLMERFPEIESNGQSGKPVDFNEPHEWLAKLSSSEQQQSCQRTTNQQTPRMTPKKTVHAIAASSENDSGKVSPSRCTDTEDKIQIAVGNGQLPQANAFQMNDVLEEEDDIVASVMVDLDKVCVQFTDDENELSGMLVSLSVELQDASAQVLDETSRQEANAVATCPAKASVGGHKYKSSATNHQNCIVKHLHSKTHSYKAGMLMLPYVWLS